MLHSVLYQDYNHSRLASQGGLTDPMTALLPLSLLACGLRTRVLPEPREGQSWWLEGAILQRDLRC